MPLLERDQFWTSDHTSVKTNHCGQYHCPPLGASTGAKKQHQHQVQFCLLSRYNEDGAC